MAGKNFNETATELKGGIQELMARLGQTQSAVGDLLTDIKSAEKTLIDKEEQERKARVERERQERLREMLESDQVQGVHVGGVDDYEAAPEPAKPDPVPQMEKPAPQPEAVPEKKETEEKKIVKEIEVKPVPEEPKDIRAEDKQPAKSQAVEKEIQAPQPESKQEAEKTQAKPQQGSYQAHPIQQDGYQQRSQQQGSYQARPIRQDGYQQRPQQGGYQQRPQQGGYQQRPQQGSYQQRPQQGGYQQRPQQGGYQQRPQQGGYQQRPQQGGYQQRPQQGGYQQRPQQGGYQQRPQQGGYQQRPQQGGYAPRTPGSGTPSARGPQQRTQGGTYGRPAGGKPAAETTPLAGAATKGRVSNFDPNKSAYQRTYDNDKRAKNKKALQRETAPDARNWDEDAPTGSRRPRRGSKQQMSRPEPVIIDKAIITTEMISVKDLSEKLGKPAAQIIKKLFLLGTMATINQELDFDTCELIASDFNIELEHRVAKTFEEVLSDSADENSDSPEALEERPPVVTIMGHVDHGKTSLLDAIRHSAITEGEAGGITQHIGAYTVSCKGRTITFIDTPGHEAFTSMRARGAQVTDIVILVVAADDGIMPQTIEAINHAKAANVPIIVAINKMDKPEADPERIKQQLTEYELVSEEWGGQTIIAPVSAKTGMGLDNLLEMVLLQADVLELKANPKRLAKGTIVEAKLDKGRGPIATVLVQNGTLKKGDTIVAGTTYGRIRAMTDDRGRFVDEAGPSMPVEVLGFNEVPEAGDILNVAEIDKLSRQVAEERRDKIKAAQLKNLSKVSLDDLFSQMAEGELKELNIIVKADVQGSVEAVKQALEKLSNEEVRVKCIHGGVGAITGSDIMFASASNAIVIGFNVRPDATAKAAAEKEGVDMRTYRIIYDAIDDIKNAMKGMFKPIFKEVQLGSVSVRDTFKVSGVGTIAGAYVTDGKIARSAQVRVVRDGIVVHEGKIASLKRFKDDVKEVAAGYECGVGIENFNDIQQGDTIEAFVMEEVKR